MNRKSIKRILITIGVTAGFLTVTASQASAVMNHPADPSPALIGTTTHATGVSARWASYRLRLAAGHAAFGRPEDALRHATAAVRHLQRCTDRGDESRRRLRHRRDLPTRARTARRGRPHPSTRDRHPRTHRGGHTALHVGVRQARRPGPLPGALRRGRGRSSAERWPVPRSTATMPVRRYARSSSMRSASCTRTPAATTPRKAPMPKHWSCSPPHVVRTTRRQHRSGTTSPGSPTPEVRPTKRQPRRAEPWRSASRRSDPTITSSPKISPSTASLSSSLAAPLRPSSCSVVPSSIFRSRHPADATRSRSTSATWRPADCKTTIAAGAEALFREGLRIKQTIFGGDHPEIADSSTTSPSRSATQHRNEEARDLHRQALSIAQNALSDDHPLTRTCLQNVTTSEHELRTTV